MKPADDKQQAELLAQIASKAERKIRARRRGLPVVWSGLGMMGLIGWSVVLPTLLGAALGHWLDRHYPMRHSWTLTLLVAGLIGGCMLAWSWVEKENQAIRQQQEDEP